LAADYASQGDLAFRDGEEDADDEAVYYLLAYPVNTTEGHFRED